MNEIEIILLMMVLIHFVADFVLQTDKQAKGKSTSHYLQLYITFKILILS